MIIAENLLKIAHVMGSPVKDGLRAGSAITEDDGSFQDPSSWTVRLSVFCSFFSKA